MEHSSRKSDTNVLDVLPGSLPLLPIRDIVVFPYSVVPLLVGRDKSLAAVNAAREHDEFILVATQKDPEKEAIQASDIYRIGTICRVLQVLDFPNGHAKVVVEGIRRAKVRKFMRNSKFFEVAVEYFEEQEEIPKSSQVYLKQLYYYFQEYINHTPELPEEMSEHLQMEDNPSRVVDFVALNLQAEAREKQRVLQQPDLEKRLHLLLEMLRHAIGYHRIRQEIDQRVQENLLKNQRNYYLQEKLKVINNELGEEEESSSPEILKLEEDILEAEMPDHALDKSLEELGKLRKIPPFSPEYTVIRNYLDWMIRVPWNKFSPDHLDLVHAKRVLDRDHYGLDRPKDRILEHLAVLKRVGRMKGPILCFVGPPGVGKTSMGRSIAEALGREFVRISLGGIRDEAEIRGHRRTYIGSMPGKIVQSMKKAGTRNPVFLLDEIDKMSSDFRGDPASALLEVLDPEQNRTFNDHYLDVDYDLSQVFFITTANVQSNIPLPLQDRMEIIELPGYLEHEKQKIARLHLIPKQMNEHGLGKTEFQMKKAAVLRLVREYTREAGVRNLERQIANICRKAVRKLAESSNGKKIIVGNEVEEFLGKPVFFNRAVSLRKEIGVATGLAWTAYGGDVLKIEVTVLPGSGKLQLTGKLGEVMRESAQTALTFIRSRAKEFDISTESFEKFDIHIHVPEGAIPKDGPSAGITIAAAILSALSGRALRNTVAMTGEITLRGKVLAVGGINEKLLAAQRNKVKSVIVPAENEKEISELPPELQEGISIIQVKKFADVAQQVLA